MQKSYDYEPRREVSSPDRSCGRGRDKDHVVVLAHLSYCLLGPSHRRLPNRYKGPFLWHRIEPNLKGRVSGRRGFEGSS